jgi:hypothetical protein
MAGLLWEQVYFFLMWLESEAVMISYHNILTYSIINFPDPAIVDVWNFILLQQPKRQCCHKT